MKYIDNAVDKYIANNDLNKEEKKALRKIKRKLKKRTILRKHVTFEVDEYCVLIANKRIHGIYPDFQSMTNSVKKHIMDVQKKAGLKDITKMVNKCIKKPR